MDVHSVSFEQQLPSFKNIAKAAFAAVTFRFERAKCLLAGEQWLVAHDAEGKRLYALSGGAKMTIFTGKDRKPEIEPAAKRGENRFRL